MPVTVSVGVLIDLRELARKFPGVVFSITGCKKSVIEMMAAVQGDQSEEMWGFIWFQSENQLGCMHGHVIEPESEHAAVTGPRAGGGMVVPREMGGLCGPVIWFAPAGTSPSREMKRPGATCNRTGPVPTGE